MPYPAAALAEIINRDGSANTCVLEDISQSGILCRSGVEFASGDVIRIRLWDLDRFAVVKHCGSSGYGFHIGLQFVPSRHN
jgi:hypothetical protein